MSNIDDFSHEGHVSLFFFFLLVFVFFHALTEKLGQRRLQSGKKGGRGIRFFLSGRHKIGRFS